MAWRKGDMKLCYRCGDYKTLDNFSPSPRRASPVMADGYCCTCKTCHDEYIANRPHKWKVNGMWFNKYGKVNDEMAGKSSA